MAPPATSSQALLAKGTEINDPSFIVDLLSRCQWKSLFSNLCCTHASWFLAIDELEQGVNHNNYYYCDSCQQYHADPSSLEEGLSLRNAPDRGFVCQNCWFTICQKTILSGQGFEGCHMPLIDGRRQMERRAGYF